AGIAGKRVAAIGPATADALGEHDVRPEIVPGEYRAEALVEHLRGVLRRGERVLLPRAAQTRDVLVKELIRLGAEVCEVPAYVTKRVEASAQRLREALAAGGVDAVTFTSSSTSRNFAELFTEDERQTWKFRAVEDRKSTRLNSSHQIISYAVFCLKKKKEKKK